MSEDLDDRIRLRSADRRRRRRTELRRAILEAAVGLFERRGYEDFSLRRVAEEIGYSATTIYNYFDDKDDLLLHVAMEGFERFGEELQAAYDSAIDPLDRLEAIGRAYVEFGLEHPVHYRLMFLQRGEFLAREAPEGYESVIDSFAILERVVLEGLESGRLPPGELRTYAGALWAHVHGIVALGIGVPSVGPEAARALFEFGHPRFVAGLAAAPEAPEARD